MDETGTSVGSGFIDITGPSETGNGRSETPAAEASNVPLPLGQADQACKECRRRKSRCNRAIPTCNLCLKYRRHCLYEKYSRTPLTRKHLTEVEERLERAEALLRQSRQFLPPHLRDAKAPVGAQANASSDSFDFASPRQQAAPNSRELDRANVHGTSASQAGDEYAADNDFSVLSDAHLEETGTAARAAPRIRAIANEGVVSGESSRNQRDPLETLPIAEDFDWDERESVAHTSPSPHDSSDLDPEPPIVDGMASLSVGEKEGGYLGVASGAALLRILEPAERRRRRGSQNYRPPPPTMTAPNPNRHIGDAMIDAYFRQYHLSYPIIHEPTFRAQYSEVIPRPNGDSWLVLAYAVAALGIYTSATALDGLDTALFARARSILSFEFLEMGNLTLVQALTLISNYQQKRDRPNSGYNYLGLAVRMAMGLGLHKEFQGWSISPLNMEVRRRVWWSLCVFDVGATITFSRPMVWPFEGVEVSLPMNVHDRELTAASKTYPPESHEVTPYTAVRTQASFHVATAPIYARVISKPFPGVAELVQLENDHIEPWMQSVPKCFSESATVPPRFTFAHAVMQWRFRNLRIIMYRPTVIRRALHAREGRRQDSSPDSLRAYERCLADAKFTIDSISGYWSRGEHNRLTAWYALYFLFQSALIPCICLRNEPLAPQAQDWRNQITRTLGTITALAPVNPSAARCCQIISELCGRYLNYTALPVSTVPEDAQNAADSRPNPSYENMGPIDESPQTQINSVFSMMWPNVAPLEAADIVMGDDSWMEFMRAELPDSAEWMGDGGHDLGPT